MKAFSTRQPWAWLLSMGYKPVENRTWPTKYRGDVLIHASKTKPLAEDMRVAEQLCAQIGIELPAVFEFGGIVGVCSITGMCQSHPSPFFFGPIGWQIAHAHPVPFRPLKGKLSFFETGFELSDLIHDDLIKARALNATMQRHRERIADAGEGST